MGVTKGGFSCIDVDVILGNCTKLTGHKNIQVGSKATWYLHGYPDGITLSQQYNIGEKPPVILYNYVITLHLGSGGCH